MISKPIGLTALTASAGLDGAAGYRECLYNLAAEAADERPAMEAEIIKSIEEVENIQPEGAPSYELTDGYKIVTNRQTILVLVSNDQSCCEHWGYLSTNDNVQEFVGAELRDVTLTDTALHTIEDISDFDEGDIQFVNFETNRGTLQLAVYNAHNGYYGHSIYVRSQQLTHNSVL